MEVSVKNIKRINDLMKCDKVSYYKMVEAFDLEVKTTRFINSSFRLKDLNPIEFVAEIERAQAKRAIFEQKVENVLKSKRYKSFIKDYKDFNSAYSMGETVEVIISDGDIREYIMITDNREHYARSSKFRGRENYGHAILRADVSNDKIKCEIDVKAKR